MSETGQNSQQKDNSGLRIESDWNFNIGEYVIDMKVLSNSNKETLIMVLGERNLFCLSDTGKIKFVKRFDFTPLCFFTYIVGR